MGQMMWMAETRRVQGGLHVCARGGCSDEQAIASHEQDCGKQKLAHEVDSNEQQGAASAVAGAGECMNERLIEQLDFLAE